MARFTIAAIISAVLLSVGGQVAAQTAPASGTDYSAFVARSAALSPADKARAQQLFATGFSLWQSGDFAAAEIGFKNGLVIDPANALANYYYGDCLARRKDRARARDYLARAVAFGGMTAEGLKAQAELQQLSSAPTHVDDMTTDDFRVALVGEWTISIVTTNGNTIMGKIYFSESPDGVLRSELKFDRYKLKELHFQGKHLSMMLECGMCNPTYLNFDFKTPTTLLGRWSTGGYSGESLLEKPR